MTTQSQEKFRDLLLDWWESNRRDFPWRNTSSPYEILVAEILLQRTRAENVEPVYEHLLEEYPTPESLAHADEKDISKIIDSLGLQNKRNQALEQFAGRSARDGIPDTEERLMELPYVGKYAANATLCFAYNQPTPILDSNVCRVYQRAFEVELDYEDESSWRFAEEMVPVEAAEEYNLALLDFAAEICSPRTPNCESCFYSKNCDYFQI